MKIFQLIIVTFIISVLISCSDDTGTYKIGESFSDADGRIGYVDTFAIQIGTAMLDSMQTSDMTEIFTGYNIDPLMGKMMAYSYIPFTFPGSTVPSVDQEVIYDSLMIYFRQTGAYTGDTLTPKKINIHRVIEDIEPADLTVSDPQLYNHNSFAYDSVPLASLSFYPRPASQRLLKAHLPDSLGRHWLGSLIANNIESTDTSVVASPTDFLEYFKGIVLIPESPTDKTWSITFKGQNTGDNTDATDKEEEITYFEVRLYYHKSDEEENSHISFKIPTGSYLFTHFPVDRSNTVIENMAGGEYYLPSSATQHTSFVQSGAGLVTKVTIPSLKELYSINSNITPLDARLIIRPKAKSYNDNNPLPSKMYVYLSDNTNSVLSELTDLEGNTVQGNLVYGKEDKEDPYYSFPIMQYVNYKISESDERPYSLLITLSLIENSTSFKRLIIEDKTINSDNISLQLYYFTY